jgi:hypothetical protein
MKKKKTPKAPATFREQIIACERKIIKKALDDNKGAVTAASRQLGFKNHRSLLGLIEARHQDLRPVETQRVRRTHLIDHKKSPRSTGQAFRPKKAKKK